MDKEGAGYHGQGANSKVQTNRRGLEEDHRTVYWRSRWLGAKPRVSSSQARGLSNSSWINPGHVEAPKTLASCTARSRPPQSQPQAEGWGREAVKVWDLGTEALRPDLSIVPLQDLSPCFGE